MSDDKRRGMMIGRVVTLSVLAFLIMVSYSIARPATESLFLEAHSADQLPVVWLLLAVFVTITVAGYSRLMARLELLRLFGGTSLASGLVLAALLACRAADVPNVHYALYLWKDIYIVLLVETFYSYANAVFPIQTARWVYGLFGVISSLGSLAGNLAVGPLAEEIGTATTLWVILPVTALMWLICIPFSRAAGVVRPPEEATEAVLNFSEALRAVRGSSYLLLLVVLIAVIQVVVTLVDWEFNWMVHEAFPDTDERTSVIGQVYAALSVMTILLHALTGPVLRLLGVPLVLLTVPALLGLGVVVFMVAPRFLSAALLKVASKCFDYTIFRAAKESLYIPLSYDEKTQGKSIVDVLSYRVAKGGASMLLMGLKQLSTRLASIGVVALVSPLVLALVALWIGLTVVVARRFRAKVTREEELRGGG